MGDEATALASLEGRTAVVTGATRGIGRALARSLAAAGAKVVLVGRSTEANPNATFPGTLEEALAELESSGAEALAVSADLNSPDDTERIVQETVGAFGGCDVLVNNAAFMPAGSVLGTPSRRWVTMLRVNAVAPLQLCQGFVPGMLERGWGRVLNVSSGAAAGGVPELFMYGASKQCLDRLTVDLHGEIVGRGVAVNSIRTGPVATEMYRFTDDVGLLDVVRGEDGSGPFDPAAVADAYTWVIRQPDDFSGRVLDFDDLLALGVLAPPDARE